MPVSPQNVPAHLAELSSKCTALASRITEHIPRSDRSVTLANFCKYVGGELKQMSRFYPENVPGLVWATRNIFETNLIIRHVLASDDNFRAWLGQALQDEKEYIEGALAFAEEGSEEFQSLLRARLMDLNKLALKHELDFSKPFRVPSLAKDVGMEDEYLSLYKVFSKYVHPSSLLINGWYSQKPDLSRLDVFLVKAQMYAGDAIYRLSTAATSIKSIRSPALGTGIGAMPFARASHQMHAAYVSVFETPDWLSDPAAILLHHENLKSA